MQWYYAINGDRHGPVSNEELARLVAAGTVTGETLVWRQGLAQWQPWSQLAPSTPLPDVASMPPPLTGAPAAPSTPPLRPVAVAPAAVDYAEPELVYGGFWLRFVAKFIDGLILGIVGFILAGVLMKDLIPLMEQMDPNNPDPEQVMQIIAIYLKVWFYNQIILLAYNWFFLAKFEATPGKLALGLRIVRADGSKLSHGRILGRFFAEKLSALVLYIGYIIAGFDDEKRAMHDMICDTRVVRRR